MAVDTPYSRGFIVIIFWTPFQASGVRTHPLVSHSPVRKTLNEAEQQAVFRFAQRSPAEYPPSCSALLIPLTQTTAEEFTPLNSI